MSFIPDQISADALASLHKEAEVTAKIKEVADAVKNDESPGSNKVSGTDFTESEFCAVYAKKLDDLAEEIGTAFAYKFFMDYSAFCLMQFHDEGAKSQASEGRLESAFGWTKDSGILQSIGTMIRKIYMGPQDFIVDPECNPDLDEDDDSQTV